MPNLQSVLKQEIQRIARREVRAEVDATKKAAAKHRREIAELKRQNKALERRLTFIESREAARLKAEPAKAVLEKKARFSPRALRAERERTGLSQGDYAKLVGVSGSTMYNWESGSTRPGKKHLATLVSLRGLGKRAAKRRLELLTNR